MGAPVNTLAVTLMVAWVIYSAKHGQLLTLMQILGLQPGLPSFGGS